MYIYNIIVYIFASASVFACEGLKITETTETLKHFVRITNKKPSYLSLPFSFSAIALKAA